MPCKSKWNKLIYFVKISDSGCEILAAGNEETGIRGPFKGCNGGRVDVFVLAVQDKGFD
jgi:hypothetical protein